uniref:Orf147a protein n=1 Tax=Solanum tuberosum TaxID=4113 RepID=M1BXE2_SOLTU
MNPLGMIMTSSYLCMNSLFRNFTRSYLSFPKVSWRKLVCNNFGAPKWLFIFRMAALERLYTKDRLTKWGIINNQDCPLCLTGRESMDHMIFICPYTLYA